MKLIILLTFFGASLGAPQQQFRGQPQQQQQPGRPFNTGNNFREPQLGVKEQQARILRLENVNNGDGTYNYGYETENGITVEESGFLKNRGAENEGLAVKGSYQYYDNSGQLYRVTYIADENGYQPEGEHLPTPPPIPPAIQKALDIIYANVEKQKLASQSQSQIRNRF